MHGVLKHIILDFCILKHYLQSVDFYFGAGCVVGQHLKERLFTERVFFFPSSNQNVLLWGRNGVFSSVVCFWSFIHHQVRDRSSAEQPLPLMTAERPGTFIYPELLKAAEIFIVSPAKECFLRIMWWLGLDIGQCSRQETNGSLPVHGNPSVRRRSLSFTKNDLVFTAPLQLNWSCYKFSIAS